MAQFVRHNGTFECRAIAAGPAFLQPGRGWFVLLASCYEAVLRILLSALPRVLAQYFTAPVIPVMHSRLYK